MEKLNMILALLCVIMLHQVTARHHHIRKNYAQYNMNYTEANRTKYTQELDYRAGGSWDKTYTLSRNESHIIINSNDEYFEQCSIEFTTISYSFQVDLLNDKIVLWDLQTREFEVDGVTLLLIDPTSCNKTSSIKVPVDQIPEGDPPFKPQVLTYKNTNEFDIFYGGRQACLPCRFNSQGEKAIVPQLNQLRSDNLPGRIVSPYLIRPIKESDRSKGYLLAYSFNNGSLHTVIEVLNANFTVSKQLYVDHLIDDLAINQRDIIACYKKEDRKYVQVIQDDGRKVWKFLTETGVYCDIYEIVHNKYIKLANHGKVDVPISHDEYVNDISIKTISNGYLCVAVPTISYASKANNYTLYFYQFDLSNKLKDPLNLIKKDFDDESGFHLKTRMSRMLREKCKSNNPY